MQDNFIRDATAADFPALLTLNEASVEALSPMDAGRLAALYAGAAYCRVLCIRDQVAAFLLAFREGADYDSENYRWFNARFGSFVYVDRIVVRSMHRGQGLGRQLYTDLFAFARASGVLCMTCEYDIEPPNPASAAFHAKAGFYEVATQVLAGGKRVSLQVAKLAPHTL